MKIVVTLSLLSVLLFFFKETPQSKPVTLNNALKKEIKMHAFIQPKEISSSPQLKLALRSIEEVDQLKEEAKKGIFENLENKILELEKEIRTSSTQKNKIEFQECLSLWIKYLQKDKLQSYPQFLFQFLSYNSELYKQYLLAIHEGFSPDMTYQKASQFLLESLKGVQR